MISTSENPLVTTIGRTFTTSHYVLLESGVSPEADLDAVSGIAGVINDYGITVVLSAVLIIFAVVMFNMIVKRSVNSEQVLMKETQSIANRLSNVESILNHETNSSEVFDRLNGKITQGFDELNYELTSIKHSIDRMQETLEEMKKR